MPRAGSVPDGLLPAQPALSVVRGDVRRTEREGHRRGAEDRVEGGRCDVEADADAGGVQGRAVLRAHSIRTMGRNAERTGAGRRATRSCPASTATRAESRWPRKGALPKRSGSSRSINTLLGRQVARCTAVLAQLRAQRARRSRRKCWPATSRSRGSSIDAAIAHFERAVRLEDGLVYTEPAEWHYPPRHALGAALLAAGRPRRGRNGLLGGSEAQS